MKNKALTSLTILLVLPLLTIAQTKSANLMGLSVNRYGVKNALVDRAISYKPNTLYDTITFERATTIGAYFQKDMKLFNRVYFSPAANLNGFIANSEYIDSYDTTVTNRNYFGLFGGGTLQLKGYIVKGMQKRVYVSSAMTITWSLYQRLKDNVVKNDNSEANDTYDTHIAEGAHTFFGDVQTNFGFNIGYERTTEANKFWFVQLGYNKFYRTTLGNYYDIPRNAYSITFGIGGLKPKAIK